MADNKKKVSVQAQNSKGNQTPSKQPISQNTKPPRPAKAKKTKSSKNGASGSNSNKPKQPPIKKVAPKSPAPKPVASKPVASKPVASKPVASKPVASKPVASKPVASKPVASKPVILKSVAPKQLTLQNTIPDQTSVKPASPKAVIPGKDAEEQRSAGAICGPTPKCFDPLDYMTRDELSQVESQFDVSLKNKDVFIFWTGGDAQLVPKWADHWGLITLRKAMGSLMDKSDPNSPKSRYLLDQFTRYMKGASGLYAQYACKQGRAIVVTDPPPNVYSPRKENTYQAIEEPILKGVFGNAAIRRIDYVHPRVSGAGHVLYQVWPHDKTEQWAALHGGSHRVKTVNQILYKTQLVTTSQVVLRQLGEKISPSRTDKTAKVRDDEVEEKEAGKESSSEPHKPYESILPKANDREAELQPLTSANDGCENQLKAVPQVIEKTTETDNLPMHQMSSASLCKSTRSIREVEPPITKSFMKFRCNMPTTPITVPVVDIDKLQPGQEISIPLMEDTDSKVFMFLTRTQGLSAGQWWRLEWT